MRLYLRGAMCHMLGYVERAIACYRHCLQLAPDFEPAKAALKLAEGR